MNATLHWRPTQAQGQGPGLALSVLVHIGLLVALALGVNWRAQNDEPALEAELWAAVPQVAAPRADPPPPPARTQPQPRDTRAEEQALRDAEIRLERDRRQQEKERLEKEKLEKLKADKLKAERDKQDKLDRDKAEKPKTEPAQTDAKREQLRQEQLRRMLGQAGATGGPQSTGTAQQSAGPSANYAGRIVARVKPNITLLDAVTGNPRAEVEIRCAPDGLILSSRLIKQSGDAAWDAAVLRAVEKTERLPRDENGKVPSTLVLSFTPND